MTDHGGLPRRNASGPQVMTTKVALELPIRMAYDEWERAGHMLAGVLSSSSWWLGDWLNYGKQHFADRYERAVGAAGLQYQTLRNYAWVAGRYPAARRRPLLSFQHHAELAALNGDEQDQWLDRALEGRLSVRELRVALRKARRHEIDPQGSSYPLQRLNVPAERLRRWREAAEQSGVDVQQWIMVTLDGAAEQVLTR